MKKIIINFMCFCTIFLVGMVGVNAEEKVYWGVTVKEVEQEYGTNYLQTELSIYNPTKLVFGNTKSEVTSCDQKVDLSKEKDESVIGCLVGSVLYIQYDGILYLNPDSSWLFSYMENLTTIEGLEYVNTSEVTNMSFMFGYDDSLEKLDLSHFDTSNVTNMSGMFNGDISLKTLDLSSFDTSNVRDMSGMFSINESLERLDLSSFNTSNVTDMSDMFGGTESLKSLDLSNFDTSNVTDMSYMFTWTESLERLDLSSFNTSNVRDMSGMFHSATSLKTLDLSSFDTSNVRNMSVMFGGATSLESLDLRNFNTSNVTDMSFMFDGIASLETLDLSSFNTSNVIDMRGMFSGATSFKTLDLRNFNTSNVTDMSFMFSGATSLETLNLSNFDTSNVRDMSGMFEGTTSLKTLDLSSFDTSNVKDMLWMFDGANELETIYVSNSWSINSLEYKDVDVFGENYKLVGGNGTTYDDNHTSVEYARIDTPSTPGYLTVLDVDIIIDEEEYRLPAGETVTIDAMFVSLRPVPIIWTSSNERIATVDSKGVVTAHSKGEVIITASVKGTNVSASTKVVVTEKPFPVRLEDFFKTVTNIFKSPYHYGDINNNGHIDVEDFLYMILYWFK